MFGNSRSKKRKGKSFRWLRGAVFGGCLATVLTGLFTPKSGPQLRKRLAKFRQVSLKRSKSLVKNSKQHTKSFIKQAKNLMHSLKEEIKDFVDSIREDSKN